MKFDAEKFRRQILATRYKDTAWVDIQDGKVVGELPPRVPVPEQWAAWESRQKDLYAKKMRLDETEGGGGGGGATKKEKDPVEVISKDNSKGNSVTYAGDCEMVDGDFLTPGPDTSITTEDSQLSIGKTRNGVGDSGMYKSPMSLILCDPDTSRCDRRTT